MRIMDGLLSTNAAVVTGVEEQKFPKYKILEINGEMADLENETYYLIF